MNCHSEEVLFVQVRRLELCLSLLQVFEVHDGCGPLLLVLASVKALVDLHDYRVGKATVDSGFDFIKWVSHDEAGWRVDFPLGSTFSLNLLNLFFILFLAGLWSGGRLGRWGSLLTRVSSGRRNFLA